MKKALVLLILTALVALSCAPISPASPGQLRFRVDVSFDVTGECILRFNVQNAGASSLTPLSSANAVMETRDEHDILRARMEIVSLPAIGPGSVMELAVWQARLDPGKYRVFWGAPGLGYSETNLAITELGGRFRLDETHTAFHPDRDMPVLPAYGDAQPLVDQAIAQLAAQLDVQADLIRVASIQPRDFPDASLGVPQPGEMYAQVITPGYVIELSHGGMPYVFHSSGARVVLAPDSRLPGSPAGSITIEAVQVDAERITVRGRSTLPDGTCLDSELWVNGEAATWWPTGVCAAVAGGRWQLVVPLGTGQAPARLDPDAQYMLRAFLPGGPAIVSVFAFDLSGPPASAEPTQNP